MVPQSRIGNVNIVELCILYMLLQIETKKMGKLQLHFVFLCVKLNLEMHARIVLTIHNLNKHFCHRAVLLR